MTSDDGYAVLEDLIRVFLHSDNTQITRHITYACYVIYRDTCSALKSTMHWHMVTRSGAEHTIRWWGLGN